MIMQWNCLVSYNRKDLRLADLGRMQDKRSRHSTWDKSKADFRRVNASTGKLGRCVDPSQPTGRRKVSIVHVQPNTVWPRSSWTTPLHRLPSQGMTEPLSLLPVDLGHVREPPGGYAWPSFTVVN